MGFAGTSLTITIFRISTDSGLQDLLALVPPEGPPPTGLADHTILGTFEDLLSEAGPVSLPHDRFVQNPAFVRVLQEVIRAHGPSLPGARHEAARQGEGWLYITDRRTKARGGKIPIEDILGGFQLSGGTMIPESYVTFPQYRLFTQDGFTQLDEGFAHHLQRAFGPKPGGPGRD